MTQPDDASKDQFTIGQRIGVEKRRGTIKYVGALNEVDSGKDVWLGVDWDKSENGKHDGSIKGRRYFQARLPTSGSFIKAKYAQVGKGFERSLRERHSDLYNDAGELDDVVYVLKKTASDFTHVFRMSTINLLDNYIAFLEHGFHDQFPSCTSLNLVNNLLDDWTELFRILELFPNLQMLDISYNIMRPLNCNELSFKSTSIVDLVLNNCRLEDETILAVLECFPSLEYFYIMNNDLTDIPSLCAAKRLKTLFVGDNPINDFTKLWHLGSLKSLQTLNLRGCGINFIQFPADEVGFENLEALSLNDNPINDWQSINELARLPHLKNLRTSGLHAGERGCQSYEMLTAKLPHLTIIDGSTISQKERRDCEIIFLNRFSADPRLDVHRVDIERLTKLHGEPLTTNAKNSKSTTTCTFTLVCGDHCIKRTLSLNLTVQKLVALAARIFKFEASDVRVSIQVFEDNYETLKWNSSTVLRAFDPEPGCTVKFIVPR